jgi:DNA-binding transcriptional MerR regulator
MPLKMKELTELTGESKPTILYYLKEGLLPEPAKPKPNVALYSDSCVDIIKFVKYLQKRFSYSIGNIKKIFANNNFDFSNSFDSLVKSLELIGGDSNTIYSLDEFLKNADIAKAELKDYIVKGYLPNNNFSKKELKIVKILKRAKELNLDFALIDTYVKSAKELAKLENQIGSKLLNDDTKPHNKRYELLFDLILNLKPYIFNGYTVKEHKENIKDAK